MFHNTKYHFPNKCVYAWLFSHILIDIIWNVRLTIHTLGIAHTNFFLQSVRSCRYCVLCLRELSVPALRTQVSHEDTEQKGEGKTGDSATAISLQQDLPARHTKQECLSHLNSNQIATHLQDTHTHTYTHTHTLWVCTHTQSDDVRDPRCLVLMHIIHAFCSTHSYRCFCF